MRAEVARSIPAPILATRAETFRDLALWSLRAMLAAFVLSAFALNRPAAPHVALSVELGRRVVALHDFQLGWLGALATWAVATASGYGGLAALGGIITVATLALVEFRARRRAGAILSLGASIVVALCFFDALVVGSGAPIWLFAAALLLVLERRRDAWLAVPIALLWCNLSPSGLLAPLLAGLVALGRSIDRGPRAPGAVRAWVIALACGIATLATPDGISYLRDAWVALHFDRRVLGVVPILPPEIAPKAYRFGLTAIVMLAACFWNYRRRTDDVFLTLAGVFLTFLDGSFLPLLGVVAAPGLAATAGRLAPALVIARPTSRERWVAASVALAAVLLATAFALSPNERVRPAPDQLAVQAALTHLASDGRAHVLYCGVTPWCDYAAPFPNVRVMLDDRVERSTPERWAMQITIGFVRAGWREALDRARADAIITRRKTGLATLLGMDSRWRSLAGDDSFALYVRDREAIR